MLGGEEDDNGASFLAGSTKAKAGEDAGSKGKNKAPAGGFGANAMEEDDEDFFPDFGVDDLDEDEGAAQPAKKAPAKPTFSNTGSISCGGVTGLEGSSKGAAASDPAAAGDADAAAPSSIPPRPTSPGTDEVLGPAAVPAAAAGPCRQGSCLQLQLAQRQQQL